MRAVVTKRKKAYAEARTVALLEPGPERIDAVASHPGAPWQVLPYERQIAIKAEQVQDALQRIGHLEGYELEPLVPAVEQWRYRNKLEYSFGTVGPTASSSAASTRPGRGSRSSTSRTACWPPRPATRPVARRCGGAASAACAPTTAARRRACCATWSCARGAAPASCRSASSRPTRGCRHRTSTASPRRSAPGASCGRARCDVGETTAGGISEVLHGTEAIEEELGGLRFRISADAFFQTNTEMAERLYGLAADYAGLQGWERVYDLFCGIGTIGLSLAPRAGEVWGLEIVEEAIADAIANARRNEIDNARFFAGDVRLALRQMVETSGRPDVLVVDPPRSGLSSKIVRRVIEAAPKRIVYVSCNPTTLAPNAAQLVEAGYALRRVRPVDMFPQTPHIECVALLERV